MSEYIKPASKFKNTIKIFCLLHLMSFAAQAENEHVKTSSTNASYGVSSIIPEWTPDLRDEDTRLKAQSGDFIAVPIPVVDPTIGSGLVVAGAYYYGQTEAEKSTQLGGDLQPAKGKKAPNFMVYALRDQIGANLDRVQIIKGWTDSKGSTHEKVYNVAWSDKRKMDSKGKIPAVGNTVNLKDASWTNTIGASELATVWTDPDFDASQRAFYYARVLEIPTPRWIVYDAYRYGIKLPKDSKKVHQERAYTSPIWYTPK